jgi:uncharacterized protein (TIGR03437 family)
VFINDNPVPLYYVSFGQINFQLPYEAATGEARVRVDRKGVRGNTVSMTIARTAPRILYLQPFSYGVIVNQDGSFPAPSKSGSTGHPAKVGDMLTIYSIGLGPTSPAVATGTGAPVSPLATTLATKVCFGYEGICADSLFTGLTPNFVGLYQVNVVVPPGSPKGDHIPVALVMGTTSSNTADIALQ